MEFKRAFFSIKYNFLDFFSKNMLPFIQVYWFRR